MIGYLFMPNPFINAAGSFVLIALCAYGQGPGAPVATGASGPLVSPIVTNPTYVTINLEIGVDRPAAEVWKRVGKYCDIGEWLRFPCTITSGKDGEVRRSPSVGHETIVRQHEV